jgi:hypothetical protein
MREATASSRALRRWTSRRGRSLGAAVLAALAVATACGGDATGPNAKTPEGTYAISTVNGKTPPVAVFNEPDYILEVTSGSLVLTHDGKYSAVLTTRQTVPDNTSIFVDSTSGTWVLSGSEVQFTDASDGAKETATWGNGQLTVSETDGKVTTTLVYTRKN